MENGEWRVGYWNYEIGYRLIYFGVVAAKSE